MADSTLKSLNILDWNKGVNTIFILAKFYEIYIHAFHSNMKSAIILWGLISYVIFYATCMSFSIGYYI